MESFGPFSLSPSSALKARPLLHPRYGRFPLSNPSSLQSNPKILIMLLLLIMIDPP